MKKFYFSTLALLFAVGSLQAQTNLLSGGSCEVADADAWSVTYLGQTEGNNSTYEFGQTAYVPTAGADGALYVKCESLVGSGTAIMFYQAVTLTGGKSYKFDFAAANHDFPMSSSWIEVYVGTTQPAEGSDYSATEGSIVALGGFKCNGWASQCADQFDGTLQGDGCLSGSQGAFTAWVDGEATYYIGVKMGIWGDAGITVDQSFDNFSLVEVEPEPVEPPVEPGETCTYEYFNENNPVTFGAWVGDANWADITADGVTIEEIENGGAKYTVLAETADLWKLQFKIAPNAIFIPAGSVATLSFDLESTSDYTTTETNFSIEADGGNFKPAAASLSFVAGENHVELVSSAFASATTADYPGYITMGLGGLPVGTEITFTNISLKYTAECTSVKDFAENSVRIYPNPASSVLNIEAPQNFTSGRILNVMGQEVKKLSQVNGQIDVTSLKAGVYFVVLSSDNNTVLTNRFIKK